MQLKPGQRLCSQVCETEIIVVRAPKVEMELGCGGAAMVDLATRADASVGPTPGLDTGSQIGKRYSTAEESELEVLVTKAGAGTLTVGGAPLVLRATKPLPSSD